MSSAPVKIAMHDLANGIWDTKVNVVISWMQPGTNGGNFLNFPEIRECLLGHDCGRHPMV
ncbi:hypothetical protein N7449_007097 [Penicillium cf. viridicatum]|uniref:Uncharacterized protein n=1 Tax=Penicillium cf. viridicatum TaxID=2972119 RepID=A0A9W9JGQ2_9EURO|nr:hypothetical protein N7449_007097 [Penicillium cf. viridicatum]